MGDITQVQDSFLGGEWSLYAQGRSTHPKYKSAMNICRNAVPLEEGAWTRRSGTWHMGTTRGGADGRLINFDFTEPTPYKIELTNGHMRLWAPAGIVYTNDAQTLVSVSSDSPAHFLITPSSFITGDQVQFLFNGTQPANAAILRNRTFTLTALDGTGTLYTLVDAISGAAISSVGWAPDSGTIQMARILDIATPWTSANWAADTIRPVQSGVDPDANVSGAMILLRGDTNPQILQCTVPQLAAPQFATFTLTPLAMLDGPYLDAIPGMYLSVSALANGTTGGAAYTYIGIWNSATAYVTGNVVGVNVAPRSSGWGFYTYYYQALSGNTNVFPAQNSGTWELINSSVPGSASVPTEGSAINGQVQVSPVFQTWSGTQVYNFDDVVLSGGSNYQSNTEANLNNLPGTSPAWTLITDLPQLNNGAGFLATDVGRAMRLFSEPPPYNSATAYTKGNTVQYPFGSQQYWSAATGTTGSTPGTDLTKWLPATNAAYWAWGTITTVINASNAVVTLTGFSASWAIQGANASLLYSNNVYNWEMGVYSNSTAWPAVGAYQGGRVWLAGAVPNRFDTSVSNGLRLFQLNMAPTANDGTVSDANGISEILNAETMNQINWLRATQQGVIMGTLHAEYLAMSSAANEAITPTNIQVNTMSHYGTAQIEPLNAPIANLFVQKEGLKIMEYLPDVFTGKYRAPNLNLWAKHLTSTKVSEIRYQEEQAPQVWARLTAVNSALNNCSLIGCTYRRINAVVYGESNEVSEAAIVGWHRHDLGTGRFVQSIMAGPNAGGTIDTLSMVTNQTTASAPDYNVRHVEALVDFFVINTPITQGWFLDDAIIPPAVSLGSTGVTLYGLWDLNGQTCTVVIGGLDCGDFAITGGQVFVPWGSAGPPPAQAGLLTAAYVNSLAGVAYVQGSAGVSSVTVNPPVANYSPATIQWLPDQTVGHAGINNYWCAPNFDQNYTLLTESDGSLLRVSNLTGNILQYATSASIFSNGHAIDVDNGDGSIGLDGFLYITTGSNTIAKINPTTFTLVAESAVILSSVDIYAVVPVQGADGKQYLMLGWDGLTGPGGMQLFDCTSMTLQASTFTIPGGVQGNSMIMGGGPINQVFGCPTGSGASNASLPMYRAVVNADVAQFSTFANIAASSVSGATTTIAAQSPPVVDHTDNNLLLFVELSDSSFWLIKVNSVNGALMWKTALPAGNMATDQGTWNHSRITGGVCAFQDGGNVMVVDTINGLMVTTGLGSGNGQGGGGQCSDSVTGINICFSLFSAATSTLGTAGLNGTPSGFSYFWAVFKAGTAFQGQTAVQTNFGAPIIVGKTFTSVGQLLRAIEPPVAGTQDGPALGKTRRGHMYATLAANSQGLSFATDNNQQYPAQYRQPGGAAYTPLQLWNGVLWDVLQGTYTFDDMLTWMVTRPYPTTIASVSIFRHTQGR